MADQRIKATLIAEVGGFLRGMRDASRETDKLADSAEKAERSTKTLGDEGAKAAERLAAAQRKASDAQDKAADAAGRLRVAQQRLADARKSGDVSRIVAAEENLAKAQRDVERSARDAGTAQDSLQAELSQSAAKAEDTRTSFQRMGDSIRDNSDDMKTIGQDLTIFGAGLTAAAGATGKFAMDWESAWTGVLKTNEGTDAQLSKLEQDLRDMTGVLPATHAEIAAVAEAAGQLGVGIDDVSEFTRVMIDMGESTNLSADEAATAIARFANIVGMPLSEVNKLGAAVVGLGNNYATTESEIMNMAMRLAAAGDQAGLSEGEILGLAAAMSSVGIEAEAGGTAMTMVTNKIDAAVREGGESLEGWAELAGTSAQQFADAWSNDPAQALSMVVEGLGAAGEEGQSMSGILDDLGVKGIREADTMRRLAGAGDLLAEAFADGTAEFDKGSALADEASKRYETAESRIAIAWNGIKDAGIDAGAVLLPVFSGLADSVADLAGWFGDLPAPVQGVLTTMTGIAGVAALAAGGFLTLAPRVMDSVDAFKRMRSAAPRTATVIGRVGKAAGIASAAMVGLSIAGAVQRHFQEPVSSIEEFGQALLQVKENADALNDVDFSPNQWSMGMDIDGIGDALANINAGGLTGFGNSVNDVVKDLIGWESQNHEIEASVANLDRAMASAFGSGSLDEAAEGFRRAAEEGKEVGLSLETVAESFPEYLDGIRQLATDNDISLTSSELLAAALGDLPPELQAVVDGTDGVSDAAPGAEDGMAGVATAAEEAAAATEEMQEALDLAVESIEAMGSEARTVQGAQDAWLASIDAITEAVEANGRTLDANTEKGRANREELRGLADSGTNAAARMAEFGASQEEVQGQLSSTYEQLVAAGEAFGLSAGEAQTLAREMLEIPPGVSIESWMSSYAAEVAQYTAAQIEVIPESVQVIADMSSGALEKAFSTAAAIETIPGYKFVDVAVDDQGTPGQIQQRINGVTGKTETVFVQDDGTIENLQTKIIEIDGKDVPVHVKDDGTVVIAQDNIDGIHGKNVLIDVRDNSSDAQARINSIGGKRVYVDVVRRQLGQAGVATGGIAGLGYFPKHAEGRLPGYAIGRLPYTGRGTDRILGVNAEGWPVARVDDGEGIINERSTRKHLPILTMANDDDPRINAVGRMLGLPGYASGNVPSREWSGAAGNPAVSVAAPAVNVDTSGIRAEVRAAMGSYRPVFKIGSQQVLGVMREAEKSWGGY